MIESQVEKPRFKIVLKPTSVDQKWKILFEPQRQDLRLLTKKVRLGRYAFLQVEVPIRSIYSLSLLIFPFFFHLSSLVSTLLPPVFPYYFPTISLLFPHYFHILSTLYPA